MVVGSNQKTQHTRTRAAGLGGREGGRERSIEDERVRRLVKAGRNGIHEEEDQLKTHKYMPVFPVSAVLRGAVVVPLAVNEPRPVERRQR